MARLYISLLGEYKVELDGVPLSGFDSDKTRLLLAYLAVEAGKLQRREQLVGLFWPEQAEISARRSLSQALYNLRQLLDKHNGSGEPFLLSDALHVQFNPRSSYELDTHRLGKLLVECDQHTHRYLGSCPKCLERLKEAYMLVRGDFLSGLSLKDSIAFEEWARIQCENMHRQVLRMFTSLAQSYENRGEMSESLEVTRRLVEYDPLWEAGQRRMMRLLAQAGQHGQALAGYEHYRRMLEQELAVPPELETRLLADQIRKAMEGEVQNLHLPVPIFPLVGRQHELAELHCYLEDPGCRLLTILGPGGSGKTRLVLEEAQRQCYRFKDGVYFMRFSSLGSGGSVLAVIADSLGYIFDQAGDKQQLLLDYLSYKQVLLVLDGFETMTGSTALVAEILAASPASKALVTSRVQLSLSAEQVFPLAGMTVPPEGAEEVLDYSAAELFMEAARRVDDDYVPDSLAGLAAICRVVDGMPLSLLLASSWVRDYPTREIAAQIRHSLDFLSVEWADLPERQRSLRATYEYSWNMLSAHEQQVLMKLSVFRAPFPLEAAESVAGAGPTMLRGLVGKSLLGKSSLEHYQMHDLVRQFSAEKLTQAPSGMEVEVRQKHAGYFLERLLDWKKYIQGTLQPALLAKMEEEADDAQAAWEWEAQRGDIEWLQQAMGGLLGYFGIQYREQECEHACQVALEGIRDCPLDGRRLYLESRFLNIQARACYLMGRMDIAHQLLDLSQEKLDQAKAMGEDVRPGQAAIWGQSAILSNSLTEQLDYLKRSADLHKELGNLNGRAYALMAAAEIARFLTDWKHSFEFDREALEFSNEVDDPDLNAASLMQLAWDYLIYGNAETGLGLMKEASQKFLTTGVIDGPAMAEVHLACAFGYSGYLEESCTMLEAALVTARRLGYHYLLEVGLISLGLFQMMSGKYEQAFRAIQEAVEIANHNEFILFNVSCLDILGILEIKKGEISIAVDDFERVLKFAHPAGCRHLSGLALAGLAFTQHESGHAVESLALLQEAVQVSKGTHCRWLLFFLPIALVVILADISEWELAAEIYAAAMTDPIIANSQFFVDMVGDRIQLAHDYLGEAAYRTAEIYGRKGDFFNVIDKLADEIESSGLFAPKVLGG